MKIIRPLVLLVCIVVSNTTLFGNTTTTEVPVFTTSTIGIYILKKDTSSNLSITWSQESYFLQYENAIRKRKLKSYQNKPLWA